MLKTHNQKCYVGVTPNLLILTNQMTANPRGRILKILENLLNQLNVNEHEWKESLMIV